MALSEEVDQDAGPLNAALKAGVENISRDQTVTFTKYIRLVLPLDGFVFWVRADLVSQGAAFNTAQFNAARFNQSQRVKAAAPTLDAKGSLHVFTERVQDEASSYSVNRLIFTAEEPVDNLDEVGPETIFISEHGGQRFAFSQRGDFYHQAKLYHYVGTAIFPDMSTQVVDRVADLDVRNVIVSNSLPLWLALNGYSPPGGIGFANPSLRLFPSFLLPQNIAPPFAAVHVIPESTKAQSAAPWIDPKNQSRLQLTRETVRITTFGVRNWQMMDFLDCVNQYTLDTGNFGLANSPAPRDEKREQRELGILGQKKSVEFEINYYQSRVRDVAEQLIVKAIPTFVTV